MKPVLSRITALLLTAALLLALCPAVPAAHLTVNSADVQELTAGEMLTLDLSELVTDEEGHALSFRIKNDAGNRATTALSGSTYYFTTPVAGTYHPVLTVSCGSSSTDLTLTIVVNEPEGGLAVQYGYDETPAEAVTVFVTVSSDGIPLRGNDEDLTILSHIPVTVPYFDLAACGLEDYYRYGTEDGSGSYITDEVIERPTALHLYLYLLSRYYYGASEDDWFDEAVGIVGAPGMHGVYNMFDEEAYDDSNDALWITGSSTSMYMQNFWGHDENLMYYRNHVYPLMSPGWGSTADYILLSDGDTIDLAMFTDWGFYTHGAFAAFDREAYSGTVGSQLTVSARSFGTQSVTDGGVDDFFSLPGLAVLLFDDDWEVVAAPDEEAEDGSYTLTLPEEPGTYHLVGLDPNCGTEDACIAPATAEVTVQAQAPLKIKQVSLSLESDISMHFYVSDAVVAGCGDPYIVFEKQYFGSEPVSQAVTDFTLGLASDGTPCHIYTCPGITAAEMSTPVSATFHDGDSRSSKAVSYSVQTYARNQLSRTGDPMLRELLVDLLCYGDAAQRNFSYGLDYLATAVLTPAEKALATTKLDAPKNVTALKKQPGATVSFRQCSLSTKDKVTINYYLNLDAYQGRVEDLQLLVHCNVHGTEVTRTVDSSRFEQLQNGNGSPLYVVSFDGLDATQMRTTCTAELISKTDPDLVSNLLSYSVESYVCSKLGSAGEDLAALLTAMLKYGDLCQAYFSA